MSFFEPGKYVVELPGAASGGAGQNGMPTGRFAQEQPSLLPPRTSKTTVLKDSSEARIKIVEPSLSSKSALPSSNNSRPLSVLRPIFDHSPEPNIED